MRQFLHAAPTKQHSLPLPHTSLIQVAASIKGCYIRLSLVIGVVGRAHLLCPCLLLHFLMAFVILHYLLHVLQIHAKRFIIMQ